MSGVKKKIKVGALELNPIEPTIILNYVSQVIDSNNLGGDGKPLVLESKSEQKRFKLKSFKATSDVSKAAAAIQKGCNLIQEKSIPILETLLNELKARIDSAAPQDIDAEDIAAQPITHMHSTGRYNAASGALPIQATRVPSSAPLASTTAAFLSSSHPSALPSRGVSLGQMNLRDEDDGDGDADGDGNDPDADHTIQTNAVKRNERPQSATRRRVEPTNAFSVASGAAGRLQVNPAASSVPSPHPSESPAFAADRFNPRAGMISSASVGIAARTSSPQPQPTANIRQSHPSASSSSASSATSSVKSSISTTASISAHAHASHGLAHGHAQQHSQGQVQIGAEDDLSEERGDRPRTARGHDDDDLHSNDGTEVSEKVKRKKEKEKEKDRDREDKEKKKKKKKDKDKELRGEDASSSSSYEPRRPKEKAQMHRLEHYLEQLYEEDMEQKIEGTSCILQLVQDPKNLEHFIENETMLGALARVLAEDRKKSVELITNILEIFFCFSSFSQLHSILLQNKVGDSTMKIIDLENKRYELRADDSKDKDEYDNFNPKEKDKDKRKFYLQKQERLLFVCFYILLNLAEDVNIELKMKQRKIIKHLVKVLKRTNTDTKFLDELHLLVITFLKKLSIFEENKAEMTKEGLIGILVSFLSSTNEDLVEATLRLLYNLAFSPEVRTEIIKRGLHRNFAAIVAKPQQGCRQVAIRLLYLLSCDQRLGATVFQAVAQPAIVQTLMNLIIRSPSKYVDRELIALAVNSALSEKVVLMMCTADNVHHLIKRVHQTFDPLLIKFIRGLSQPVNIVSEPNKDGEIITQQSPHHALFKRYLHELVGMALKCQNHDFLVESLGTLANICLPDVLYSELVVQHGLLDFLMKHLVPGFADDDILLEVVQLIATIATDPKAAPLLASSRLIRLLNDLLNEKMEDVELVLQLTYALFKLLLHKESRDSIVANDGVMGTLIELVSDPNQQVRSLANHCLDLIIEFDEVWREKIRTKRFEAFNREWLTLVGTGDHQQLLPYNLMDVNHAGHAEHQHQHQHTHTHERGRTHELGGNGAAGVGADDEQVDNGDVGDGGVDGDGEGDVGIDGFGLGGYGYSSEYARNAVDASEEHDHEEHEFEDDLGEEK